MPDGTFRTLSIGRGDVGLVRREGIHGIPARRRTDAPMLPGGIALGATSLDAREVLLVVGWSAVDAPSWKVKRETVRAAFQVGARGWYTFDDETRQVDAIVTSLDIPEDWEFPGPQRLGTATAGLICPDPRVLAVDEDTTSLASPATIANPGTTDAPFTWTVTGPAADPTLVRSSDGATLALAGPVDSGAVLTVDLLARTADVDGDDVWHQLEDELARPAQVWGIPPGGDDLTYSGGGTATLTAPAGAWL